MQIYWSAVPISFLIVILLNAYKNSLYSAAVMGPKIQEGFLLTTFGVGNSFILTTRAGG